MVIACGGGGIPVLRQGSELKGASAIIEKDYASGKLAELLEADILMILTNDEKVCLDHTSSSPRPLDLLDTDTAEVYIQEGQFGETAMLPKIRASVDFIKSRPGQTGHHHKSGTRSGGPGGQVRHHNSLMLRRQVHSLRLAALFSL